MKKKIGLVLLLLSMIIASANAEQESLKLNVLSFNLRYNDPGDGQNAWPHRKDLVTSVFGDHRIDLAGLQEVLADMVQDLQNALPNYGWIGVGRNDGRKAGEFAPIFYNKDRLELKAHGDFWLSESPDIPSLGWDATHKRIATWGIFLDKQTQREVFFLNTHFDNKGKTAQKMSAILLIQKVLSLSGNLPVIVTGDFNAAPDSATIAALTSDPSLKLTDAESLSVTPHVGGKQSSNEFQTPGPAKVIDYIFVGPGIQVESHGYYPTIKDGVFISDHWPVVSRLAIHERVSQMPVSK